MTIDVDSVDLTTPRLLLRPYRDEFAPDLFTAARESIATLGRWMRWCHAGYTIDGGIAWVRIAQLAWREAVEYAFAIFDRSGHYVGGIGINQIHALHHFANLGYWIRESRQRQGLATEATRAVANFGFDVLKLTRLEIVAADGNAPSRRVAEKVGATLECVARNRLVIHGVPCAATVHCLVPGDVR